MYHSAFYRYRKQHIDMKDVVNRLINEHPHYFQQQQHQQVLSTHNQLMKHVDKLWKQLISTQQQQQQQQQQGRG
jgi:hypothetical protein